MNKDLSDKEIEDFSNLTNKVLEQLRDEEELSYADFEIYAEEHGLSEDDDWHHRGLGRAVEIVKRGGVDGKIDRCKCV